MVGGILFLGLGWHVYSVRKSDEALRVKVRPGPPGAGRIGQQRNDLEYFFARPENAKLHDRSAFLNTLIDEQSLNWTQMFMDLEKILPAGVRVVSIEPKHEKGRVEVKLTVGAMSDEAKLKFLHALEHPQPSRTWNWLAKEAIPPARPGSRPDRSGIDCGVLEELMRRDFKFEKRAILLDLVLLVVADIALAVYGWNLAAAPRPQQELAVLTRNRDLLRADIKRAQEIRKKMPAIQKDCDQFEESLFPESTGYSSVSAELGAIAGKAGLAGREQTFRQDEVKNRAAH